MTRRPVPLFVLWLAFLVRGSFYATVLPLWEGFDEYGHFAVIQHTLSSRSLPQTSDPVPAEVEQSLKLAPLPWELRQTPPPSVTHDAYWRLSRWDRARREAALARLRDSGKPGSGPFRLHEAQQPPLYYWLCAPLLYLFERFDLTSRVLSLRWFSLLIASLVVPLGFLLSRRVLSREIAAFSVVAVVSLMPELMLNVVRVGNECLAVPLFTALVLLAVRMGGATAAAERWSRSLGFAALLGVVLGAGLLTKAFFVTAIPALLLLFAWTIFCNRGRRLLACVNAVVALALAAGIAGWWYWRNYQLTGSWTGEVNFAAISRLPFSAFLETARQLDWWNALDSTLNSHLWCAGWSFVGVRAWIYHFFDLLALAAFVGLLVALARYAIAARQRNQEEAPNRRQPCMSAWRFLLLLAFYGFFWLGLAYHAVATFLHFHSGTTTGWYLYSLVVVEVLLVYCGLSNLLPRTWQHRVLPILAGCFILLEFYATHFVMLPYYTGFIRHSPNGMLEAFHPRAAGARGFREMIARLDVNKAPFVTQTDIVLAWLAFLLATLFILVLLLNRASKDDAPTYLATRV